MTACRIPVNVLTGFLGSGKTSLLRRLITTPVLSNMAVIINEFGELGLDHHLVEAVDQEMVLLQNGCVCCSVRDDLGQALRQLHDRRVSGAIPDFDRVVIETTGLADPVPVLATLRSDPVARHHFRPANVVTTVDAVNFGRHIYGTLEGPKQIAVADRLVITKSDLADEVAVEQISSALRRMNGAAPIVNVADADAGTLFAQDAFDLSTRQEEVLFWLKRLRGPVFHDHDHEQPPHEVTQTFSVATAYPIDWAMFGIWLSMLLHHHGNRVLRVKGILNVEGSETPVVINGVQHLIHPPVHLNSWPDGDRQSKLVFIVRGLDAQTVRRSLMTFGGIK